MAARRSFLPSVCGGRLSLMVVVCCATLFCGATSRAVGAGGAIGTEDATGARGAERDDNRRMNRVYVNQSYNEFIFKINDRFSFV